jgi:hypothetical protein
MRLPLAGESAGDDRGDVQGYADSAINALIMELDWQPELDSALEAIDACLPVKRRRSTDPPDSPPFPRPELSALTFTPEVLDALATRLAEKLRPVEQARSSVPAEPAPHKANAMVTIRFRWPLFSLGLARRRRWVRAQA